MPGQDEAHRKVRGGPRGFSSAIGSVELGIVAKDQSSPVIAGSAGSGPQSSLARDSSWCTSLIGEPWV